MASEAILKELFEVAKGSTVFKGMTDENVWNACLKYEDRSDSDIQIAMQNIQAKDVAKAEESNKIQEQIQANKKKLEAMHQQEVTEHQEDEKNANNVLEEFFSS